MRVISPIATGNGAHVVHSLLERQIRGYRVCPYSPMWTLVPPMLGAMCRRGRFDLIHTTPDYAPFFTKRNTPLVITFHNFVLDAFMANYSSVLQRWHYATDLRWFTKMALGRASVVTAVSNYTADLVRRETGYQKPIRTIYNGIDTKLFTPAHGKRPSRGLNVLVAGNMTRRKGADLISNIAKKLEPGITIQCATGLRTLRTAKAASPRIRLLGSIAYDEMPSVYRQADLLLFPTVREGFGLVVAEAMACGLPIVTSDCSSLPELVDHGKGGFLVRIGDTEAFAERINQLASSPNLRREMGQYNRAKAERLFSLDRMVREYENLFQEAIVSY